MNYRKTVALQIKESPYCMFGFAAINGKSMEPETLGYEKIRKFIADFGG